MGSLNTYKGSDKFLCFSLNLLTNRPTAAVHCKLIGSTDGFQGKKTHDEKHEDHWNIKGGAQNENAKQLSWFQG